MTNTPEATWACIAAVARDTGLSKDLLRVWERRYGFPQPLRDNLGERRYPPEQVQRLRAVKRLLDAGQRPGQLLALPAHALHQRLCALQAAPRPSALAPAAADLDPLLQPLMQHDVQGTIAQMSAELLRLGLGAYVLERLAPLVSRVGQLWAEGRMPIHQEHLFSEAVQQQLRGALAQLPIAPAAAPRVLISTLPGEEHGLGVLMAQALLVVQGCHCLSLGLQTPVEQLALAAREQRSDVVALSCSAYARGRALPDDLRRLRALLPAGTELWAGGAAPALRQRRLRGPGLRVIENLADISTAVAQWRARQAGAAPALTAASQWP